MSPTSHDVARMAGVSQSTVSRALRGEAGISAATQERVRQAAAALSYVPSETGRSLSTRSTRRIGVVAADLTNPFYPQLVEPMRAELDRAGYRMLLVPDREDAPLEIERLADGSLDGVILTTATLGSPLPHQLAERGVPFVLLNRTVDGVAADSCSVDNVAGAALVANLLAESGHRRIGAMLGPADTSTGRDRERGFREALAAHGLAPQPAHVRRGHFSYDTGHDGLLALLDGPQPPTAVFCGNDVIALGALNAAAARGLTPGRDLCLVGFDDIAAASWDLFRLTTVRGDLAELAASGVRLLVDRLRKPGRPPRHVVLQPELVLRATHSRIRRRGPVSR